MASAVDQRSGRNPGEFMANVCSKIAANISEKHLGNMIAAATVAYAIIDATIYT
jgi:hypothetical protein